MKTLIWLIVVIALGWVSLTYIAERTVKETTELINDEIHTDWVKCAKECENDTIIIADSINTEGDAVR